MPSLSVVIVTHDSRHAVEPTVRALTEQLREGDELIVVDNASVDGTATAVREIAAKAIVIETGANLGFAEASNQGARAASAELLCLLNPDAVPAAGWRAAIERPLVQGRGWSAWQGLVTASGGTEINTRGGVVHFTGIAWAGGAGERIDGSIGDAPGTVAEPGFVSGACLAIERSTYLEAGGMAPEFFLYHEDVDLSLRLRLSGGHLGVEPSARVDHDYDFAKGGRKWHWLERNRWATLIRTYPASLLVLLAPALVATELALVVVAARGGWLDEKLEAWKATLIWLPRLLRERRQVQRRRTVTTAQFARSLSPELDSPYLGAAGRSRTLAVALRSYWALVLVLVGAGRG